MPFTVSNASPTQAAGTAPTPTANQARDRAIARLMGGATNQTQETPVANPNQVSPEEMSALKPSESKGESSGDTGSEEGQKTPSETLQEATTEESQKPLSAQFAQLARKEKTVRAMQAEVKAKEADLANRETAIKAKEAEYSSNFISKAKLLEDPFGTLSELGITYEQVTQQALNQPSQEDRMLMSEIKALKAEINGLKDETKGTKDSIASQQKQNYDAAVLQIRKDTESLVNSSADYEAIKATDSVKDVVDLIEQTFKEEGRLMTVEEACKAIEEELEEEILKVSRLNKIQAKLKATSATAPNPAASGAAQKTQQGQPIKTLTNAVGNHKPMTSRERAIAAFNGKLDK